LADQLLDILGKVALVIFGGLTGSIITSRYEKWKALKAYDIVRIEIDRNINVLEYALGKISNKYLQASGSTQEQIIDMLDATEKYLPSEIKNLLIYSLPSWSFKAWDSQIPLLASVLSEEQVRGIYDLQAHYETLNLMLSKILQLVEKYGESARDQVIKYWKILAKEARLIKQKGNPLIKLSKSQKLRMLLGQKVK